MKKQPALEAWHDAEIWSGLAADVFTHMCILASKLVNIKVKREEGKKTVWQRENEMSVFIVGSESYLSPLASLPLGALSTSAAPLSVGFDGQRLTVFFRHGAARPGHTAHFTGLEPSSTGGRAL